MRKANVYYNGLLAGELIEESRSSYIFRYTDEYFNNKATPEISLTLPKIHNEYRAKYLFPFFYNMLSEGANKKLQTRQLKIDEADSFGLLLATAGYDTIGAITVKPSGNGNAED